MSNGLRGGAMRDATRNMHELNFNEPPFIAIWEATQACDLACVHCRASAQPLRSALELSTVEAQRLMEQIAAMQVPVFVITGGDPLKRPDIFDLLEYATARGVRTSLTPSFPWMKSPPERPAPTESTHLIDLPVLIVD